MIAWALPACQRVGILREINVMVEVRHHWEQTAGKRDTRAAGVEAGVGAGGSGETETGRHSAQEDDRGPCQDGHKTKKLHNPEAEALGRTGFAT